jgi:hypothetical protein
MTKQILMIGSIIGASILFTGCATLFGGGSTQTINVQSSKTTTVDMYKIKTEKNQETGEIKETERVLVNSNLQVPASINVNRDSKDILIKPKNNDCKEVTATGTMNNWVLGDVLALSLLSTTVDAVTGAMWKYDDNITLDCK